jgi:hypothetical protein
MAPETVKWSSGPGLVIIVYEKVMMVMECGVDYGNNDDNR